MSPHLTFIFERGSGRPESFVLLKDSGRLKNSRTCDCRITNVVDHSGGRSFGLTVVYLSMISTEFISVSKPVLFYSALFLSKKESKPKMLHLLTSVQTRLPAEFKHITKRRKRN